MSKNLIALALCACAALCSQAPAHAQKNERPEPVASLKGQYGSAQASAELFAGKDYAPLTLTDAGGSKWTAPQAGCLNCNNSRREKEWSPNRISFEDGFFMVEYSDSFNGNSFAYKISFMPDPVLDAPRAASFQRIGSDKEGKVRLTAVDFVKGTKTVVSGDGSKTVCAVEPFEPPSFQKLSLANARLGAFEPPCAQKPAPMRKAVK